MTKGQGTTRSRGVTDNKSVLDNSLHILQARVVRGRRKQVAGDKMQHIAGGGRYRVSAGQQPAYLAGEGEGW